MSQQEENREKLFVRISPALRGRAEELEMAGTLREVPPRDHSIISQERSHRISPRKASKETGETEVEVVGRVLGDRGPGLGGQSECRKHVGGHQGRTLKGEGRVPCPLSLDQQGPRLLVPAPHWFGSPAPFVGSCGT